MRVKRIIQVTLIVRRRIRSGRGREESLVRSVVDDRLVDKRRLLLLLASVTVGPLRTRIRG
jgi:hypothetical protein